MSVNWAMVEKERPIPLENENFVYKSDQKHRISLSLVPLVQVGNKIESTSATSLSGISSFFAGTEATSNSSSIKCARGQLFLSTQRLLFIYPKSSSPVLFNTPGKGESEFQSFSLPLEHVSDSKLDQPWFGPNGWTALIKPVLGGGLVPENVAWTLKLTFYDGGAYEYVEDYDKVKMARSMAVNHIEELPRYEE